MGYIELIIASSPKSNLPHSAAMEKLQLYSPTQV